MLGDLAEECRRLASSVRVGGVPQRVEHALKQALGAQCYPRDRKMERFARLDVESACKVFERRRRAALDKMEPLSEHASGRGPQFRYEHAPGLELPALDRDKAYKPERGHAQECNKEDNHVH